MRSIGKPQVSWSRNALSPESTEEPAETVSWTAVSRMLVPVLSVLRNAASSPRATVSMRLRSSSSSGYCGLMALMTVSTRTPTVGSAAPSSRMLRMARRMMRRST